MKILIATIVLALLTAVGAQAQDLKNIQKIYVGEMGQSDEAARFRILLGDDLTKVGFAVVDSASKADATLSGIMTVRVYSDTSIARATVSLSNPEGVRIWGKDFEAHVGFHLGASDSVRFRAEDIAKSLRKECKKK
jgi:hypothetical protein